MTRVQFTNRIAEALFTETRLAHPHECCGLMLGDVIGPITTISAILPTTNVAPDPLRHFEIDPAALIAAHRAARANITVGAGPAVVGYYHSHPTGESIPSATDAACAAHDGLIWAIVAGKSLQFWRDGEQGFEALSYDVMEG